MFVTNYRSGPFGNYPKKTTGHILNALCHWGVPISTVEVLRVGNGRVTNYNGDVFATFKYFDGLDQPLFRFTDHKWHDHPIVHDEEKGLFIPQFRLRLSPHNSPGLLIDQKQLATPVMHAILQNTLTNYSDDEWYKVRVDACAFFQGGSEDPNGEYFYIELSNPAKAQAYVNKLIADYAKMYKMWEHLGNKK